MRSEPFWAGIAVVFGALLVVAALVVTITAPWRIFAWLAPIPLVWAWAALAASGTRDGGGS